MPETIAYVGIGSNLGKSEDIVANAIADLKKLPGINEVVSSSYYLTDPVGGVEQDQFINAVMRVKTTLDAEELLKVLNQLEKKYKRVRTIRWGPRTLDLDIELFGNQTIHSNDLTVPHQEMFNRLFVLVPLLEIIEPDNPYIESINKAVETLAGSQYIQKIN
ncbi:2-amino-4-hydroxy-6-hydroxymethyldihydropteridine diphosphokinase [Companilactobacillus sp.]|jgi:2-amino-4-hydroxy-6-hydroxymethyldihydropteridine diphosphokinase|uniref:2-amino-4-hydroxy-6- hydroxymethyldihydropteridine diphosphokinase n=1 Tax=Companilactobacillus sp. TaxID=2767905 RepID=UPI0025C5D61D|nr:2-amino-4-hydroxy-6-hydroxymethyldihydropteridine diphosphokinase [Companilactobacillus sp.]MCH4009577.1 2-amino-4-hydroxy-6-hydroxymethyldihydropteridine diphosphokinase [Companilactobacillus sp.]MCH4052747.1 2-amino-4-hydroxy-6-hydroxymethyldihydropteridine diphosphokinase [Companilactobacillus sp.]MCH4077519.1 2-amino-4-hydroxy-6-hydroxymethyldihydropteridine diphosphokinase [Companilactobacillus sp.]MCH4126095.1 2-amino-4-hydroxy-6-hydroxymethyldihydropteridine diphosphokinase [Companila